MIEFCVQYRSNAGVAWLLCPSRMRRRYLPIDFGAVCLSNTSVSHLIPSSFDIQPFSLTAITQSGGIAFSSYQLDRWILPLKMIIGGRLQPVAPIASIAVTHSRSPGWICNSLPCLSDVVTTREVPASPIANPVSSKL